MLPVVPAKVKRYFPVMRNLYHISVLWVAFFLLSELYNPVH